MNSRNTSLFTGVFFLSMALLIFEVALTRIFSIILNYHYVFIIISFAILGLGLGGIIYFRLQSLTLPRERIGLWAVYSAGMSIPVVVYLLVSLPVATNPKFYHIGFYLFILLANIPFIFGGIGLSWLFRNSELRMSLIYGADLLGAGAGAMAAWAVLQMSGGISTALFAGAAMVLASVFLTFHMKYKSAGVLFNLGVTLGFFFLHLTGLIPSVPVGADSDKDMYRLAQDKRSKMEILQTKWSAFGRTDLVRDARKPHQLALFIDGAAGTPMMHRPDSIDSKYITQTFSLWGLQFFPFAFLEEPEKNSALIIGPGGGKDVYITELAKVEKTTAVEVNPDIVSLVRQYGEYNGYIYEDRPNFKLHVAEGRQFVKQSKELYDIIMLAIPVTKSKRSYEGYALTEDYLFTVEAMNDYLKRLTPEGRIIILAHGQQEVLRLFTTALQAFERQGIAEEEAMNRMYAISDGMLGLLVVKNTPFTRQEAQSRHEAAMHKLHLTAPVTYFPYVKQVKSKVMTGTDAEKWQYMFDPNLVYISQDVYSSDAAFIDYPFDVSPVTDDRPFFYDFKKGLPSSVQSLFFSFILLLLLIITLALRKYHSTHGAVNYSRKFKYSILFFTLLGMGYMMAEIALFQKILPFFSNPTLTLSVLLATLLIGSGIGGCLSQRIQRDSILQMTKRAAIFTWLGLFLFVLYHSTVPMLSIGWNRFIMLVLLFGVGIPMGFQFPLLLRLMSTIGFRERVPWFWGINGVASVTGAVLSVILAKWFGWTVTIGLAGGMYLLIALLAHKEQNKVFLLIPLKPTRSMIARVDMSGLLSEK